MSSDLTEQLQQQLRDIHTPDAISWWPLAVGWWVLAALLLVLIGGLILRAIHKRKINRYRVFAAAELDDSYQRWQEDQNCAEYLQESNAILKRTMRHISDDNRIVSTSGAHWIKALADRSNKAFSAQATEALSKQLYQREAQVDIAQVHAELKDWLKTHQMKPPSPSPQAALRDHAADQDSTVIDHA